MLQDCFQKSNTKMRLILPSHFKMIDNVLWFCLLSCFLLVFMLILLISLPMSRMVIILSQIVSFFFMERGEQSNKM